MKGNISQRGKHSWRLKFDLDRDPATGERRVQFHTVRGTKREAQIKLAELIASAAKGEYVEPAKDDGCRVPARSRRSMGGGG
jgi:hypothetical protein